MSEEQTARPVHFVVVEFDDAATVLDGFHRLHALIESGSEDIVDVEFVRSIHGVASTALASGVDPALREWDGLSTGLLGSADRDLIVDDLSGESREAVAAVVIYAGPPAADVLGAWQHDGARVVRQGSIDPAKLAGAPGAGLLS